MEDVDERTRLETKRDENRTAMIERYTVVAMAEVMEEEERGNGEL